MSTVADSLWLCSYIEHYLISQNEIDFLLNLGGKIQKKSDLTRVCRQLPIASGCALRSFSAFESFLQDPRFFLRDVTPVFVLGPQLFPDVLEPDVGPNEMENHSILLK